MYGTEGFDFWWLIPIILIALCMFGARRCCSGRRPRIGNWPERNNQASSDSALDILSKRYARGEIDDEEYQRKRQTITQTKKEETR